MTQNLVARITWKYISLFVLISFIAGIVVGYYTSIAIGMLLYFILVLISSIITTKIILKKFY